MAGQNAFAAPPSQGLAALCATAALLTELLEKETRLVTAMRIADIGPLQAEKARLTKLCGTTLKTIDQAQPIVPALKAHWHAVSKRLGDAAVENERALRVGHAATDRLVGAIVTHIESGQKSVTGYTRPTAPRGPYAGHGVVRRPALAGVTVDRQL